MFLYRQRDRMKSAMTIAVVSAALGLFSAGARAGDDAPADASSNDNLFKTIFKTVGMATDAGPPQDFVVKARPPGEKEYIPVGRKAFERPIKAKTPDEVKAVQTDLDAVNASHDALRSSFPPAAQAVAAAEAAKAAKAGKPKKPPAEPANPQ
jgi:hypothetical protein